MVLARIGIRDQTVANREYRHSVEVADMSAMRIGQVMAQSTADQTITYLVQLSPKLLLPLFGI